jgi:hypothetical protein
MSMHTIPAKERSDKKRKKSDLRDLRIRSIFLIYSSVPKQEGSVLTTPSTHAIILLIIGSCHPKRS